MSLLVFLCALTTSTKIFAAPTFALGILAGEIGDAGSEWSPTVGLNIEIGPSLKFRHFVSGIKRGAYQIYGSHSDASYSFPITSDNKTLRFRLGAGYMRKTVSVLDNEMRANDETADKYTTGYAYFSNGFSARTSLGIFYAALDFDGLYYPNALLPFFRGYGFEFTAVVVLGVEL